MQITQIDVLKKGLTLLQKVLNEQAIKVTRGEMIDLINFESVIGALISQMELVQNKTPEELLEMLQKEKLKNVQA